MEIEEPSRRASIVGRAELERGLRALVAAGGVSNGWLITGPEGAGKATLAYRLARAILEPGALAPGEGLDMAPEARAFRLIAGRAHPDLFVADRPYDEKTERQLSEIPVETIRNLTGFLNRTAAGGGWRVAIIDPADALNRNAANALLKSLEEPPQRSALFLVCNQPSRLPATIRSRCRRIRLAPLTDAEIDALLCAETSLEAAQRAPIVAAARGRPGRALALAAGEAADAVALAGAFLDAAARGDDPLETVSGRFGSGGGAAGVWAVFVESLLDGVAGRARAIARGIDAGAGDPVRLAEIHAAVADVARRGEALNIDRQQMLFAFSRALRMDAP
jgi:DNA polymerase-3 subunit delta'